MPADPQGAAATGPIPVAAADNVVAVPLAAGHGSFDTPTDIDIYTLKVDYEEELWGGKLGVGSKLSRFIELPLTRSIIVVPPSANSAAWLPVG